MSFPNISKWTKTDPKTRPSAQAEQRAMQSLPQAVMAEISFGSNKLNVSQKAPALVWDHFQVCKISLVLRETLESKVHTGHHRWSVGTVGSTWPRTLPAAERHSFHFISPWLIFPLANRDKTISSSRRRIEKIIHA